MNTPSLIRLTIISLLLFVGISTSCKQKKAKETIEPITYSEAQAKEVSFVTNGDVHFDTPIQVFFNNDIIEREEIGSSPKEAFQFSPSIKGKAVWVNRNSLEFRPDEPLPMRQLFDGIVKLQALSDRFAELEIEDLQFRFRVRGREIEGFNASLELKDRSNPKVVVYSGTVSFTEKTDLSLLEKSVSVKGDGSPTLSWSQLGPRTFKFSSSDLERTDKKSKYRFTINKKHLQLENDFTQQFTVSPLKSMEPEEFRVDETGRSPRVRIVFSDELAMEQSIDGLISVSPSVKFSVKKIGKTAVLDGNFKFGQEYAITVGKGIQSRWGTKTVSSTTESVLFAPIAPQLEFASDGIILPSSSSGKVQFYTANLKHVHLQVKKVFTNQVGKFIQSQRLTSTTKRSTGFFDGYESAVGVIVKSQTIDIKEEPNKWLLHEFDLSELFAKYDDGLFLLSISFTPEDCLIPIEQDVLSYLQENGQVYKPIFLSDIGLTLKEADGKQYIFASNIITGKPLSSVSISLLDWSGDVREKTVTNSNGVAVTETYYFYYIMAQKGNQVSVLNRSEMQWSQSGFDVGGMRSSYGQTRGFIYTERGVYRPGDSIYVSVLARNNSNTFPANHPITLYMYDPNYNRIFEQTKTDALNGLYAFALSTEESAPTGTYQIRVEAGGAWFYHDLKIETVTPDQLDVQVIPAKRQFYHIDDTYGFDVKAKYLFGAPASNLQTEVSVEYHPYTVRFPKYADFSFTRSDVEFLSFTENILKEQLNDAGELSGNFSPSFLSTIPSALKAKITAKVLEKGGQTNEGWSVASIHVYSRYVGLKDPDGYGYYQTGQQVKFPVMLLDAHGEKIESAELSYKIYRNDKRWWYQYDTHRQYQLKYKEDSQTYVEVSGEVEVVDGIGYVEFIPAENGEYLIEVSDKGNGHSASLFFSAYRYGGMAGGDMNVGTLVLKSDKDKYAPTEKAKIILPNPQEGAILVTLEQGQNMLNHYWITPNTSKDELVIEVPLNKSMIPNVYVTVSVIQPHEQTVNDRPIRMFGIIPIFVEDPSSRMDFSIETPETLLPNRDFEVKVNTLSQKKAYFTIAVVDEGLLSLTQFRTPNPWSEFYKKYGLFVNTYDLFSHIINANKGDVFQTFSIGGDEEMDYRTSQLDPIQGEKRFKAVSMFKGPLSTDDRGRASVKFTMPNYNGAVRVMVVGTNDGSFGSAEKTVPVRSGVIMQPSIPRMLKPADEFTVPVALFRTSEDIGQVELTLTTQGPLEVVGSNSGKVLFGANNEGEISFKIRAKEAVGAAKIILKGTAGGIEVVSETDIKVVPSSVRVYDSETKQLQKGETLTFKVPKLGVDGTNYAALELNIFPNMNFEHRLKWLINYPFGCIEQITSTLFPQLYLKQMGYFSEKEEVEVDRNLNEGIAKYSGYTVPDGGFAYWPGNTLEHAWGTNYATHFLIEAKKQGYAVPDYLYNRAIGRLESLSRIHLGDVTTRVNRVFVLALAQKQVVSEMNMLLENDLEAMSDAEKWMLAAAYHLSGVKNVKDEILHKAGTAGKAYEPFSSSFGSAHRDEAIILYAAVLMNNTEIAEIMAKNVAKTLSSRDFLGTQSTGYLLLALGKYFQSVGIDINKGKHIGGTVTLANGKIVPFGKEGAITIPITDSFGKEIKVALGADTKVDAVYATLAYNGVPLMDESEATQKNLSLKVAWYNEEGQKISPQSLKQGDTFYGRFTVANASPLTRVSELALTQVLPSGWQIENLRLTGKVLPSWTREWNLNRENYLDIRDDRVMWFFDVRDKEVYDFVVKLNCVNPGEYWMPGTLLEAMYNNDFKATTKGMKVYVEAFE